MISHALEVFSDDVRARRSLPSPATRRAIREEAGMSRASVARACGVTEGAVRHWEDGTRRPSGQRLHAYAAALRAMRGESP